MNTTTILILSIIVFLVVVMLLVLLLVFVRNKLLPQGKVHVEINNKKDQEVPTGGALLSTLANEQIFLPSACGGKGSCGQCKCRVTEGGGTILPTETGFFTRKQIQDHWRLGCQVKVNENLKIQVPDSVLSTRKWECEVVSNHNVATFIKEFVVKLPEGENIHFEAGNYIQIDVPKITVNYKDIDVEPEYREDWDNMHLWDLQMRNPEAQFRAYSMANAPAEGNIIMLNVRIATPPFDRKTKRFLNVNPGICSSYIYSLKPGDKVTMSGPYGEFHVDETQREMMFIGGGAGMAPMRSQIFDQIKTKQTARKASFWYGGRSLRELFYVEDFTTLEKEHDNFSFHIALSDPKEEDNWTGYVGFIHNVIYENYLKNHPEPEEIEYYLCGPPLMISAVLKMLDELGVPSENILFDDFGN
ncbi:MAG: NADH:ubiquinone reductase (Na(+)-transporting) subunit F [Candidatus Limimorpha sp.]